MGFAVLGVLMAVNVFTLTISLVMISRKRRFRVVFVAGATLTVLPILLASVMLGWLSYMKVESPDFYDFCKTIFLITAGIGGNIVASSVFLNNEKKSEPK